MGQDSGSAASTTKAAISGVAGNKAARTGDAETGIQQIFDASKTRDEVGAQVAITSEFGKQAPKAVANFADSQRADLLKQLKEEADPTKRAQLSAEAKKWEDGGTYRVLMHTTLGALAGGSAGALGAGTIASTAPLMNEMQDKLAANLEKAGLSKESAEAIAKTVAQTTALATGAALGGTQGGAMALNVDANNRQLHPSEKKKIAELAKSTGLSEDKLGRAACYAVKCWAEFPEGSKERDAAYVSAAETFGLNKEMAAIQSAGASTGLFGYSVMDQTKDAFKSTALPVIKNSAKTVGGGLAVATGSTICGTSGVGCVVGAPLAVFGASEVTEGATGLYRQYQGQGAAGFNPVRSGLNTVAPVWGDTIYDGTYLGLSVLTLGATVPLKVGASDGINRANSMFSVTVPRWQNPIVNPLTNAVVLPQTAAQGVLLYGVGAKVPALIEDVKKAQDSK
jgi:filamentous hemagglutinin